jgi:hypothetical protein
VYAVPFVGKNAKVAGGSDNRLASRAARPRGRPSYPDAEYSSASAKAIVVDIDGFLIYRTVVADSDGLEASGGATTSVNEAAIGSADVMADSGRSGSTGDRVPSPASG